MEKVKEYGNKFDAIPAAACTFQLGEFEFGDNGENAKTAPVKLKARSGDPIEHWWWGRVVHDLSGMRLHKPRLPIDYAHDAAEVIGYLNHFDSTSGDLMASGALVPFSDTDRASEIIHKQKAGVPYEASINFGGDGLKFEEIPEGYVTTVNGREFAGPGVVVREWPLRGVAICPYGADMNTESAMAFADKKQTYAATAITPAEKPKTEGDQMSEKKPVEVAATVEEPAVELTQDETTTPEDTAPAAASVDGETEAPEVPAELSAETVEDAPETSDTETSETPEAEVAETVEAADESPEDPAPEVETPAQLSREEFCKIADEFGADIAAEVVRDGGDYHAALKLAYDKTKAELAEANKAAAANATKHGAPVPVSHVDEDKPKALFKV